MSENIAVIFGVIGSIGAGISIVFKGIIFSHQTNISLTLLSHEDREKHKLIEFIKIILLIFFISFLIGMVTYVNTYSKQSQVQEIQNENNNDIDQIAVYIYSGFILFITFIIMMVIQKNEKKDPAFIKLCKFERYMSLGILLFFTFLMIFFNIIYIWNTEFSSYVFIDIILSFVTSIFAGTFLIMLSKKFYDEVATIKTYFEDKFVYLFGMKDSYFIAGDSMYINDCELFYFIKADKIMNQELYKAKNDDDVFLQKSKVEIKQSMCNKKKRGKNELLRIVAADCAKKKKPLTIDSILYIDVDNQKEQIRYAVGNDKNNECEIKSINREEWNGNVLLI